MADRPPIVNPDTPEKERPPIVAPDMSVATAERPVIKDERPPIKLPSPNENADIDSALSFIDTPEKAKQYEDASVNTMAFDIPTEETIRSGPSIDNGIGNNPRASHKKTFAKGLYDNVALMGDPTVSTRPERKPMGFLEGFKTLNNYMKVMRSETYKAWMRASNRIGAGTFAGLEIVGQEIQESGYDPEALGVWSEMVEPESEAVKRVRISTGKQLEFEGTVGREMLTEQAEKEEWAQLRKYRGKNIWDNPELMADPIYVFSGMTELMPYFAVAMATGGAGAKTIKIGGQALKLSPTLIDKAAKMGLAFFSGGTGGHFEGVSDYEQALKMGKSPRESREAYYRMTLASAGLNAFSFNLLLNKMPDKAKGKVFEYLTRSPIGRAVTGYFGEGAPEGLEEIFSSINLTGKIGQSWKEALTVMYLAGPSGAGTALVTGAPAEGLEEAAQEQQTTEPTTEDTTLKSLNIEKQLILQEMRALRGQALTKPDIEDVRTRDKKQENLKTQLEQIDDAIDKHTPQTFEEKVKDAGLEHMLEANRTEEVADQPTAPAPQADIADISAQLEAGTLTQAQAEESIMDRLIDPLRGEEGAVTIGKALVADEIQTLEEAAEADILALTQPEITRGAEEGPEGLRIEEQVGARALQQPEPTEATKAADTQRRIEQRAREEAQRKPAISLVELLRTDPIARQREIDTGISLLTEQGHINLQAEVALDVIRDRLSNFRTDPRQGIQDVLNIGRAVFAEGKAQVQDFTARMKEIAGEAWETVKPYIQRAWEILNNEAGLIGGQGAETFEEGRRFTSLADRQEKFEISDEDAKISEELETQNIGDLEKKHVADFDEGLTLDDVLFHPELYAAYPGFTDMRVVARPDFEGRMRGYLQPTSDGGIIFVDSNLEGEDLLNVLIHETQHAIQEVEGFAVGGSPDAILRKRNANLRRIDSEEKEVLNSEAMLRLKEDFNAETGKDYGPHIFISTEADIFNVFAKRNLKIEPQKAREFFNNNKWYKMLAQEMKDLQQSRRSVVGYGETGTETYLRLAGEVEARDTVARMNLTEEERIRTQPLASQAIPLEDMIVNFRAEGEQATSAAIEISPEGAPEFDTENRIQTIRTQARSKELPAFMEDNPTWSEEEVDTALDKAQQGKPITEREAEIVHATLAEAGAQFYQEATGDEFITLEPDEINAIIEQGIQDFVSKLEVVKPVVLTAEQKKKKDRTKEFARRGKEIANLQDTLKETAYLLHQSVQDQASVRQEAKLDTKAAKETVKRLESKIATRDNQVATLREKSRIAALNIPKPLKPKAQIREATGQVKSPELRDLARSLLRQEGVARAAEREGRKDEAVKVRERIKGQMERARGKTDETAARNKLRAQIKKMLKTTKPRVEGGKPVGKFTPEVQRSLDKLREAANLSAEQADSRIAENLAKYPDQLPPDEIALENRVLSIVHGIGFYGQIFSDELAQIRDELREMIDEGRMMNELKKFNREAQVEKWVAEAVHVLTGGKGLPEGASAKTRKANYDRIQGLTDRTKQWFASTGKTIVGFDDVMDILSGLDPSTPFESDLNKLTDVMEAESAEKRGIKKSLTKMQDMYMEAFGIEVPQGEGVIGKALADRKRTKLMIEQMQADAQQIDLGTFTDLMGRRTPLEISRSEARKRYMEFKDPSLADTFTEGMAYTNEMKQAILGTLTTRDRAFADAQLEFLQEYYDSINEVYRDLYGVDLPKNEFYSPIIREGFGRDASKGFGVMLEEINLRPSVTPSGAKSRTPNILPISDMGDISILQRHMAEMEHFKAWAQRTKDLRAIFDNAEVRAAIELFHDPKLLGVIENFMAKFMRGGVDTSQNMDTLDKWRVNMARSVLAIKPAIGIKQLTSFVAYADAMPVAEFAKYSAKFWMNPIENAKTLYANSTVLAERGAHMERDLRDAQNTDEYKAFRLSPSFMNTLMLNIKMGDQGAIVMGGWPLYQYTLDQGATQEEAIRVFEKVTSGTQQSADLSQLSVWQSSNSFAKLFTTYKSSPNQYFRKELGALRNLMRGRQSVAKTAKTIFIFHMLLPMLFQFVSDGFEIDEEEQLRAIVLGPLNGVFIAGDILEQIIRAALGQRQFDSEIPMMSVGDDAAKAISTITSDDITSEDFLRATRALAGVAGHVTGVPAKSGIDIGTGVVDIFSGDYERGIYEVLGWSPYKAQKASEEENDSKKGRR